MSAEAQELASVKCSFQGETRVIRVRKDIPYNAFILKASEEFGLPLVVDTYEDAEGELITLGENGAIEDLGTQLSFGAKHRPYALKIYLRRAGTRRLSTAVSTQAVTGERRRSSETAEDHKAEPTIGLVPSKSFTANLGNSGIRRRDSKSKLTVEEDINGRRGSTGEPYMRRSSLVDMHVRHSSAGQQDHMRRSSVDSDGDALDEVSSTGAPWEPPFERPPQGVDMLDWVMQHDFDGRNQGPIPRVDSPALGRGGNFSMHVEIPANNLHVNTMARGSIASMDSGNLDTPGSASSALKTPTRVSPMISPFGSDSRFPLPVNRLGSDSQVALQSPTSHSVVIVPARHADEPEYELPPSYMSVSSNGSSHSDLPSFHQHPFPSPGPGQPPGHFGAFPRRGEPPSPSLWRGGPAYPLADSEDIEREILARGGRKMTDSEDDDDDDIDVVDSDHNRGIKYAFAAPTPSHAGNGAATVVSQQAGNAKQTSSPSPHPKAPSPIDIPNKVPTGSPMSSPKPGDLRSPMNKSGGRRAERTGSMSSSGGVLSPKPQNLVWKKGDLIGRGGFGSVYKGLLSNGQSVAVKQLELPPDVDPTKSNTYVSFMKEIDMLKTLNHPNIVRYIGSTVEGHAINVFLEYVPGGSIASMVSKYGPFEEEMMKLFSRAILQALSYLHRNNIAHRDVKGANILVDIQGIAKLADFGCSKSISVKSGGPGENFQTMLGTPYWMAPEVMRQEGHGRMADIWSFGCTLVEMASGKPPWAKDYTQIFALLYEVGNSQKVPEIPEHLSPELKDLMRQCFRRTPTERPTAEQLLRHPWFKDEDGDELYEDDEFSDQAPNGQLTATSGGHSFKKRSANFLMKSMSASRSQALQEQPKSLEALPEQVLLHLMSLCSPTTVIAMARTCAHLRFLAQRNSVWVALATNQWPKLRINLDAIGTTAPGQQQPFNGEADFGKKLFMACLKYDRRFLHDPLYRQVRTVKGHTKKVYALQILEGASRLISCAGDKKIKIWDVLSVASPLSAAGSSSISSSGSNSLSGSGTISKDSSSSSSSSSKKKKASTTLRGHNAAVTCFHASNTILISGSSDGMIKVWDMKSKKCTTTVRTGDQALTGLQLDEKLGYLVTSSSDGVAKIWDLRTLDVRHTLIGHKAAINALKFHHHTLATVSSDKRVKIWDLRTGTMLRSLHGHKDDILCVDIVGDTVIAGSSDGSLLEWSIADKNSHPRAYSFPLTLPASPITTVTFDGVNTVMAGREDGNVVIWKYHSGQFHSVIKADSGAVTALTASNQVVATAGYGEKIVKVWALVAN